MELAGGIPWREAFDAFERLLLLDQGERSRVLLDLHDSRPDLYPHVVTLIRASEQAESAEFLLEAGGAFPPALHAKDVFGPYRLERPLGTGGMGEVWLAQRADGLYDSQVAIKTLHPHLARSGVRERFVREGRLLARLQHPHIARLLDAGVLPSGGPLYLVLEYVEGTPLDVHCDSRHLGIDGRLRLFATICEAVAHAHAHLVVHRDLKPSNILVTDEGVPKLLDFGIAKLVESDVTAAPATDLTRHVGRAMTPEYAAPEQFRDEPVAVATDVYALGAVLYRLLCGCAHYGSSASTPAQIERAVLEADPIPPSRAAGRERAGELAALRGTVPRGLRDTLSGDLDTIVLKSLKKTPDDRYASATALADDIRRYLDHRPVEARPDAWPYRARKYVRRNRLAVAAAGGIVVVLVAGIVTTSWQASRARHEADRAKAEAERSKATQQFMISLFEANDPRYATERPRGEITARQLLDIGADRVEKEFAGQPEMQLELLGDITDIYEAMADEERYEALSKRRVELARATFGPSHPIVIQALISASEGATSRQEYDRSRASLAEADRALEASATENQGLLRAKYWSAKMQLLGAGGGTSAEIDEATRNAVAMYQRIAPWSTAYAAVLANAAYFARKGRDAPAQVDYNLRALAIFEAAPDRNDRNMQITVSNLALAYEMMGDERKADETYARAEELALEVETEHHQIYWLTGARHARMLHRCGHRERADAMFDRMIGLIPADWSVNNKNDWARGLQAISLAAEGRPSMAIATLEATLKSYLQRDYGKDVPFWRLALADAYDRAGRPDEARDMFQLALKDIGAGAAFASEDRKPYLERWGRFLIDRAGGDPVRLDEANSILAPLDGSVASPPRIEDALVRSDLARIALARGDVPGAGRYSGASLDLVGGIREVYDLRQRADIWGVHATVLAAAGDRAGAADWARRAVESIESMDDPASDALAAARARLQAFSGG